MNITIASGKGGTGKTTVATNLALVVARTGEKVQYLDCDVEEPNGHLFLKPLITKSHCVGIPVPEVDTEKCTGCGVCEEVCRFDAIKQKKAPDGTAPLLYEIDTIACEGCGVCAWFCMPKAIDFSDVVNGRWFVSETRFGPMVHAKLGIAEDNSGKLVTLVKSQAKLIAEQNSHPYIIVDGSPGIGCPVIASVTGADMVVIVTEPTVSGEHDLERVANLTKHFGIPTTVCINKYDINPEVANRIETKSKESGVAVIGKIRYDKAVTKAQVLKTTIVEYTGGAITRDIEKAWRHVVYALG